VSSLPRLLFALAVALVEVLVDETPDDKGTGSKEYPDTVHDSPPFDQASVSIANPMPISIAPINIAVTMLRTSAAEEPRMLRFLSGSGSALSPKP
jgi:hypothetical protein